MPSTRQIRLNHPKQIRDKIREFVGKKINVVLTDNRVIIGELKDVNAGGIKVFNMRLKPMQYSFENIAEIYFDVIV